MEAPRSAAQRKRDAIDKLHAVGADVWVASASADGIAHLVPLSYAWIDERIVLAVEQTSVTARNIVAAARARLGFGPTRDVVMADAVLERTANVADEAAIADAYATQAGWDPRGDGWTNVFLVLTLRRVQVWREANEIDGRTVMRDAEWLI